ncbi:TetR/AcrR family transcriptional regulator [Saccharibacillus sp. JS10]|uniref:TetR/AcrR family transcriptional regulator n=1 Tax=Saccharibacillus sp. JS10 TaxID=2950552 RepID=UPI00210CDAFE|nr:TetR/AcrR family transcriptional regulator [Saccharibacillus sp. JS10]MCQ4087964.1 TetR/AcrR family transcriptional regulator [Saccharibacillus sp. JS10]
MSETWHQHRKQQNRDDIIAAGRQLFFSQGFPGVSVKDVCEQAGVSRVTYYKHFQSIDELVFTVQMQALEHLSENIQINDDPQLSGRDRLHRMLQAWSVYTLQNKADMRFILLFDLHYDAYPPDAKLLNQYKAFIDLKKQTHFLNAPLQAGISDGSLRPDLHVLETGEFIFTAMMGLLQKLSFGDPTKPQTHPISQRMIDMILSSLSPR